MRGLGTAADWLAAELDHGKTLTPPSMKTLSCLPRSLAAFLRCAQRTSRPLPAAVVAAAFLALTLVAPRPAAATTIFQAPGSPTIVFQATSVASITTSNAAPTAWVVTNDVTALTGKALYQAGVNGTASASSFALYSLKFTQAGTYTIYYRWRADVAYTTQDPNSANSFRLPIDFGDLPNDATSTNFVTASVNNAVAVPAANAYNVFVDSATLTVTPGELAAGSPLVFKIGTREAGMFLDRFALSTDNTLTAAQFNALANSDTDVIVQAPADGFVAFPAFRVSSIVTSNAAPTMWVVTNDVTALTGQALYQAGVNGTASASSFALYALKFSQAGTYSVYYRWRADAAYTTQDPNSANSFRLPIDFGDLANDAASANFVTATVNNAVAVPAANSYNVFEDGATLTVTPVEVAADTALIFKIGTREAGMFIDRFVLSLNNALTAAQFNALPNTGSKAPLSVASAVGSASLASVSLHFSGPIAPATALAANFALSGGLKILGATLDPTSARDIALTTSAQSPGSNYVVTVNGVTDVSGTAVSPNSKVAFTAWKLSPGWVTRQFYFNIGTNNAGGGVADLVADPKYPNTPDQSDLAEGFMVNLTPSAVNYGARLETLFTPPTSGAYEFFLSGDAAGQLYLSTDTSEANLALLIDSPGVQLGFDPAVVGASPTLTAGKQYLLQGLYRENSDPPSFGVAARPQGGSTPPANLPILGGNLISTYINPDAVKLTITQQPVNATGTIGARARFSVKAVSGGPDLYYQWQLNGTNIAGVGATRAAFTTSVLSAADNGGNYSVIVSAAGGSVSSASAKLSVVSGPPPAQQPYIGINFTGGGIVGDVGAGGLDATDVAGVVAQANWNNIPDAVTAPSPLADSAGAATPVSVQAAAASNQTCGTGVDDADHVLFDGFIHNANSALSVTLSGVPSGNYSLLLYSVGFNFNSTYEEAVDLTGAAVYPTLHVRAQDSSQYIVAPGFVRMSSTDPNARQLGNYVQYDNVSPATDGSLTIVVTPESTNNGINYFPPLNAIQLVKSVVIASLSVNQTAGQANVTLSWPGGAAGYVLESTAALGPAASWSVVSGAPNPIAAAGSLTVTPAPGNRFYRLRK